MAIGLERRNALKQRFEEVTELPLAPSLLTWPHRLVPSLLNSMR